MNVKKEKKRKPVFFLCCFCGTIIKTNRNHLDKHEKLHEDSVEKIKCAVTNCKSTFVKKQTYWDHWQKKHKDIIMPNVLHTVIEPRNQQKVPIKRKLKTVIDEDEPNNENPIDFCVLNALGLIHKVESTIKIQTLVDPFFGVLE